MTLHPQIVAALIEAAALLLVGAAQMRPAARQEPERKPLRRLARRARR